VSGSRRRTCRRGAALTAATLAALLSASVARGGQTVADGSGCAAPVGKSGKLSIPVAGAERRFLVRLPAGYDGKTPRPIIFGFHFIGGSGEQFEEMSGLTGAWPEAIVVYPEGLERSWPDDPSIGGPGWQLTETELGERDLKFFDALRSWLLASYCVDRRRMFAIGFSNGGYFSNLLGCVRADAIAAVAPAGGGMRCEPAKPVAAIVSHGKEDHLVPFSEATKAEAAWASRNGCSSEQERLDERCERRKNCDAADVVFCPHPGGHEYERSFTKTAVEFFKLHARK
jgi:polyhydroxybutyrate depolymerase